MLQTLSIFLSGFLSCLFLISGCTGLTKEPLHKNYFDLAVTLPAPSRDTMCNGKTVLVKKFDINQTFDSHSFVYRIGINEYVTDYYNEFVSSPARLITEKVENTLCVSNRFASMSTDIKKFTGFRLSGKITRLYGDFQDPSRPRAVIEIQMSLEKGDGTAHTTISSKTYLAQEIISSQNPSQLVSGWNTGLSKIVMEFITDFKTFSP